MEKASSHRDGLLEGISARISRLERMKKKMNVLKKFTTEGGGKET